MRGFIRTGGEGFTLKQDFHKYLALLPLRSKCHERIGFRLLEE
jgi:hypothetical protein